VKVAHTSFAKAISGFVLSALIWLAQPGSASAGDRYVIRVAEGLVSVEVERAPLRQVLGEISVRSGVTLLWLGSRDEEVSARFESVPLDQALSMLVRENFFLVYSGQLPERPVELWVFRREHAGEPKTRRAADEPAGVEPPRHEQHAGRPLIRAPEDSDDGPSAEAAIDALRTHEDVDARAQAVAALRDLGDRGAFAALSEAAASDTDESVRQEALAALAALGGRAAVEPLARALRRDPDPFVRYEAVVGLAEIGGARAGRLLVEALHDADELVRAKAEDLLLLR
jgi:hypothetical protein